MNESLFWFTESENIDDHIKMYLMLEGMEKPEVHEIKNDTELYRFMMEGRYDGSYFKRLEFTLVVAPTLFKPKEGMTYIVYSV